MTLKGFDEETMLKFNHGFELFEGKDCFRLTIEKVNPCKLRLDIYEKTYNIRILK